VRSIIAGMKFASAPLSDLHQAQVIMAAGDVRVLQRRSVAPKLHMLQRYLI
jgi:hypothetical protein